MHSRSNMEPVIGEGGQLKVQLATEKGTSAEIYLHGAHVTSFKPFDSKDVIFVSKEAIFKPPKAIRGGIPICWPQFNDMGAGQAHGFARNTAFSVIRQTKEKVVLLLAASEATKETFPYDFELEVVVAVSDDNGGTLSQSVSCKNKSDKAMPTTQALHTYFCVTDITKVSITGLESSAYLDNLAARAEQAATQAPITISQEVDRIYMKTGDTVVLCDEGAQRDVVLQKSGFEDVVVWNPWIDKAANTQDFGNEEYRDMVCLEASNAAVHVSGGSVEGSAFVWFWSMVHRAVKALILRMELDSLLRSVKQLNSRIITLSGASAGLFINGQVQVSPPSPIPPTWR